MTNSQPSIHLDLNPQNPAQFFACCGVFELAAMFANDASASFHYDLFQPYKADFELSYASKTLCEIVTLVKQATPTAIEESGEAPVTLNLSTESSLLLDWWLKPDRSGKSRFKLWAGNQTTAGLVRTMLAALPDDADNTLFSANKKPMSGRFGLDPRSAWNTLDFGSSVNEQGRDAYTFPAAEMLSAIGLQGFRPRRHHVRTRYKYYLWSKPLHVAAARAAVAGALPIAGQLFSFTVEKRSGAYSCFSFAKPIQGE
ncbi:MAG: hypothetical protein RBT11_00125 [Desulfobacterales bacterium]|jgi:hypothetical protein|nr:hypothetical protein [Desulfobacterales bacterium]